MGRLLKRRGKSEDLPGYLRNTFRGQKFIPADLEDKKGKSPD